MHLALLAALFLLTSARLPASPDNAALFAAGQAALAQGALPEAAADFRQVLATEPHSGPARANLGVVYMRQKKWTEALAEFHQAQKFLPESAGLALNIGLAYFHQNQFAQAIPPFALALRHDPASLQARYLLGLCYFASENYREALGQLEPLWPSESGKLAYLYVLAQSADKAGDPSLEQRALKQMFETGHDSAEYHLFLGRGWLAQERHPEAVREFQEAVRLNPSLPFAHYSLGSAYQTEGQYQAAKKELLADLAIEPGLALDYQQLGAIALKLQQLAEAEHDYETALKLDPQSAAANLGLAKIYTQRHEYPRSLPLLDAATRLDPESASAHYLRGQALQHTGRMAEARDEFAASARLRKATSDRLEGEVPVRPAIDAQLGIAQ